MTADIVIGVSVLITAAGLGGLFLAGVLLDRWKRRSIERSRPPFNCEITIRSIGDETFWMEASWPDTKKRASMQFKVDPDRTPLTALFRACEAIREA